MWPCDNRNYAVHSVLSHTQRCDFLVSVVVVVCVVFLCAWFNEGKLCVRRRGPPNRALLLVALLQSRSPASDDTLVVERLSVTTHFSAPTGPGNGCRSPFCVNLFSRILCFASLCFVMSHSDHNANCPVPRTPPRLPRKGQRRPLNGFITIYFFIRLPVTLPESSEPTGGKRMKK